MQIWNSHIKQCLFALFSFWKVSCHIWKLSVIVWHSLHMYAPNTTWTSAVAILVEEKNTSQLTRYHSNSTTVTPGSGCAELWWATCMHSAQWHTVLLSEMHSNTTSTNALPILVVEKKVWKCIRYCSDSRWWLCRSVMSSIHVCCSTLDLGYF